MLDIVVTVDDDHLVGIDALVGQLQAAGMRVEQVLSTIGVITGSVAADRRTTLTQVAGVSSVEEQPSFQLPPPDSEIQ